jgi:hypothetical protein
MSSLEIQTLRVVKSNTSIMIQALHYFPLPDVCWVAGNAIFSRDGCSVKSVRCLPQPWPWPWPAVRASGRSDVSRSYGARLFNFAHFGVLLGFLSDYWRVARGIVPEIVWFCWPGVAAGGEKWLGMLMQLTFLGDFF